MTHAPAAAPVHAFVAHQPQAQVQLLAPPAHQSQAQAVHHALPAATGQGPSSSSGGTFQPVSNTYSIYDVHSNYIGGSVGLQAFVDGLYINVLHRQGTADETGFWTKTLESGQYTPYTVVSFFLQSPEAVAAGGSGQRLLPSHPPANIYTGFLGGDVGVKAFVDGLYYDVLQRNPDPAGEAYWVGQIENFDQLPANITFAFLASSEYQHALGK